MKKARADRVFDACNIAVMVLLLLIMLYPLYYIVIASVSEPYDVAMGKVFLKPSGFTLEAYRNVFENRKIWVGYRNTVFYTLFGTLLNLGLTLPTAYVLSKKQLMGRTFFSWYFLIPMYFGGGLIPTYLLVKSLRLINTPVVIVIMGGLSIYNMIVTRTYFTNSIPEELYESARIDGASDLRMFFTIAIPLAVPIIAVVALFYAVARWNDYYTALIYVSSDRYYPLQMMLRSILLSYEQGFSMSSDATRGLSAEEIAWLSKKQYIAQAMKYALIFIASAPLLILYPFVQKYFIKGMMIGSLKG